MTPHRFTLRQLQYAVAVADTLSFRRAAERCHVSQPSLSTQLAQMEGALAVQLFERDRRRVLPTQAGLALLERMRRILLESDDLDDAARRVGDPLTGTLHIGVIPTISPYLLPSLMPALRKKLPRLTVAWREDKTEVLTHALEHGDLDAALLALEADVGDVEHAVLASDPFVLAGPPDHPLLASDTPVAPRAIQGTGMLLLDEGHCLREQALAYCTTARADELELRATSLSTLVQMVAAGAGVTLLPILSVPTESRRAKLRIRRISRPTPERTIALVWRKRSPLASALRTVAGIMKAAYPSGRG